MAVRNVFITYRRSQTAGEARALFNDLVAVLGSDSVFMDVDTIALGRDFRQVIRERLESCDLLLALVGSDWATVTDGSGHRRLDDPNDFVRLELETALKRGIPVTPVLVQGARMPAAEDLPAELREFAFRNNFELSHNRWRSDIDELLKRLGVTPRGTAAVTPRPPSTRRLALLAGAVIVIAGGLTLWWSQGRTNGTSPPPTSAAPVTTPASSRPASTPAEKPESLPAEQTNASRGQLTPPATPRQTTQPDAKAGPRTPPVKAFDPTHFVNSGIAQRGGRAVLIVDAGQPDLDMTSRIATGISASESLFKPDFVTGGLFAQAQRGDLDVLKMLPLDRMQLIALGTKKVTTSQDNATGASLARATIDVQLRLIRPADGYATSVVPISVTAGGVDERRAIDEAMEKAVSTAVQRLGAQ